MASETDIIIYLSKSGKNTGLYTSVVSDKDKDLAELSWQYLGGDTEYARREIGSGATRKTILMHRLIMERVLNGEQIPTNMTVDHINGDGLDNRRENLRLATIQQNNCNTRTRKGKVVSYKGVSTHYNKYRARIRFERKLIYLGLFNTPEEAHEAYKAKAKELFGEFARFE